MVLLLAEVRQGSGAARVALGQGALQSVADPGIGASGRPSTIESLAEMGPQYQEEAVAALREMIADPGIGTFGRRCAIGSLTRLTRLRLPLGPLNSPISLEAVTIIRVEDRNQIVSARPGSWNGMPGNPSAISVSSALHRAVHAGQAINAKEQASPPYTPRRPPPDSCDSPAAEAVKVLARTQRG